MFDFQDHGFGTVTPARPIPPCRWDRFDLLCVHEGMLELDFEQEGRHHLRPGQGVLIYPETGFQGRARNAPCRISVQHFMPRFEANDPTAPSTVRDLPGRSGGYEPVGMPPDSDAAADIHRAIALAHGPQAGSVPAMREALLMLILTQVRGGAFQRVPSPTSRWAVLEAQLRQRPGADWRVESLAQEMGLSPGHFRTRFRAAFGQTPAALLKRLRLEEAKRLLRETDRPIKAIARQLGYRDLSNFYRAFRRAEGLPPARYRERRRIRG